MEHKFVFPDADSLKNKVLELQRLIIKARPHKSALAFWRARNPLVHEHA